MIFSNDFLESIANDPVGSIVDIINTSRSIIDGSGQAWTKEEHDSLFEGFSLLLSVIENFDLSINAEPPKLIGTIQSDSHAISEFLTKILEEYQGKAIEYRLKLMKNRFDNVLGQRFVYEFSKGDINRIQELISELREEIATSTLFESNHKERLLKRLERLQSELHKHMSDIDKFWGLVGDAGVVLGKFGNDAKPFVKRIKEIADIIWRTQSRAEELPSGTPTPLLQDQDID